MSERVIGSLSPVRRRQQLALVMRNAAYGLIASSLAGMALGLLRWSSGESVSWALSLTLLAFGPLLGAAIGIIRHSSLSKAAGAIDSHYGLKDRAVTALDFANRPSDALLQELQLQDASDHLRQVDPRQVAPVQMPRSFPYAMALLTMAAALLFWPLTPPEAPASPSEPFPEILAVADVLTENLEEMQELAKQEQSQELENLIAELKEKIEEIKQPGVNEREALAKLSEMQAAVAAQHAQYNAGLVDNQLAALGAAMSAAEALDGVAKALQNADFDKAAKALEELEDPKLSRKEAKTVAEKMKEVAKSMKDAGLGQLSQSTGKLAEGLQDSDQQKIKSSGEKLAREVEGHCKRCRIQKCLLCELAKLSECKSQCQCNKNSLVRGKKPQKSTSPSNNYGLGESGNINGEKTNLLASRKREEITGEAGEGPSELETTHSPEGREQASRSYRDAYNKYRRMSEAVLDSEPIPLGHRQTIRRYFELIRPQNDEDFSNKPAAAPSAKGETPASAESTQ